MEKNLCIQKVPYVIIKWLSKVITMIHGSFKKKTAIVKLTITILPAHTISASSNPYIFLNDCCYGRVLQELFAQRTYVEDLWYLVHPE